MVLSVIFVLTILVGRCSDILLFYSFAFPWDLMKAHFSVFIGHLIQRANSLEKALMLGKIEGKRRGCLRMRWLDGIISSMEMSLSKLWETVKDRKVWRAAVHGFTKSRTWRSDRTTNRPFGHSFRWTVNASLFLLGYLFFDFSEFFHILCISRLSDMCQQTSLSILWLLLVFFP